MLSSHQIFLEPLEALARDHARRIQWKVSADPEFRGQPGAGKTSQLTHNLDTVSRVEKLNLSPSLCSYLLEHQQSLSFKVLKDVSFQSFFIPIVQIAFAMQNPTLCFYAEETTENTSQGGSKRPKSPVLSQQP